MKTKGQHRGHCQKCGAIQVVLPTGKLADHGYTIPNGYFKGTCQGSSQLPLQVSRVITDAIIRAMNDLAARNKVHAIALGAGQLKPEQVQQLTAWGSREYTYVDRKQVPIMKPWSEGTGAERTEQLKLEIGQAESDARFFRSHAKSMSELAQAVHGTALIDREAEELARITARKVKSEPIIGAFRTKIEQKRELEKLSNAYSKAARVIKDHYLHAQVKGPCGNELYYAIPFELHNWRAKHTALVLDTYPELASTVEAIEILVINRNEIKARPVIR
jgi:hypothetical protein